MLIAVEVYQKEFTDRTMKNAYLQACKWVSGEFIAVNNSKDLTYKFEKKSGKGGKPEVFLEEIGPRFEMRPYQILLGTVDQPDSNKEWVLRPFMNTARNKNNL